MHKAVRHVCLRSFLRARVGGANGHPPFDNLKIRRAALYALSAEDGLKATIGDPEYYSTCKAMFGCGTKYESLAGIDGGLLESNFEKSRALLGEAGYDGTPVVLMQATDVNTLANLGPVSKTQLERGGFKVDMGSMRMATNFMASRYSGVGTKTQR